ncbi:LSU ribosomal protein L9P [Desulfacinum hydrothermale DSM 13146]|uniref:Large ribosomal subunit protein bL9 n=1 Tax=Desulfacinum hydrothermale DSM 13146 TaxID=1121390 RepID=A0A1W1XRD4_9BACT|nr:50S ribosomal protein L9 [Desulfacinum hydrothermale]SMC26549.1 LSU ribosomal protein L9P [Desulfacinum hydrothermale DSM 13146]
MKVILTENIPNLGRIGDIVKVAPGYARNYLVPKGLALEASSSKVKELEHHKRMLEQKREKVRREMQSVAEKLNQVTLTFSRKVVEEDKLYGSVNVADIHKALTEQGFDLDRRVIQLDQPIKQLGEFSVPVKMDAGITSEITVVVTREE